MEKFVPREKMSKKAQKEENRKKRRTWEFSPVTRQVESRKIYNRKRKSREYQKDWPLRDFLFARRHVIFQQRQAA